MLEENKKSRIRLQPNITWANLATFFFATSAGIGLMTFVSLGQALLLTDSLKIPLSEHGVVGGRLQSAREIVILFSVLLAGILADKISRKFVFSVGFIFLGLGFLLFPFADSQLQLLCFYGVSGIGAAFITCMLTTLLADYVLPESRGTVNGIQSIMLGIGGMLTVFILLPLPKILTDAGVQFLQPTKLTYFIVAVVCWISAIIVWFGLSKFKPSLLAGKKSFLALITEGFKEGKKSGVALAYFAAFISRGDLVVVGTFLVMWVNKVGVANGLTSPEATAKARAISGIGLLSQFFLGWLIGILIDKISRKSGSINALIIAAMVGFFAYGSMFFVSDPFGNTILFVMFLVGIAQISGIIASQVLIAQQADEEIRGSVIGFFQLCGAGSQILLNWFGGILFDKWGENMPFVLVGLLNLILAIAAIILRPYVNKNAAKSSEVVISH